MTEEKRSLLKNLLNSNNQKPLGTTSQQEHTSESKKPEPFQSEPEPGTGGLDSLKDNHP